MEDGISQMRRLIFITCAFAAAAVADQARLARNAMAKAVIR